MWMILMMNGLDHHHMGLIVEYHIFGTAASDKGSGLLDYGSPYFFGGYRDRNI